ncbi:hypothetical protein [Lentisalinibacter sediminis]|uniref:hypothetical protein n=2 Tax=Lentisalinibacter sediminis TaxID=2992237 RepID=UPI0038709411
MPGGTSGGMPGGDASGGASGGTSGDAAGGQDGQGGTGAEGGTATTGEGGAYGTVGSVGEREPGPGGMTDVPGGSGGQGSLDDEFERSLGDFDDSLLEEQQKVAEVSRDTGAFENGGGSQGGGVGLGEQAGEAGEGSGGTVGVVNNSAGGAGGSMRQEPGSVDQLTKEQIGERTPGDIPSGVDDDIVAKQLREAALAEEDPELRERLWDEYRSYKGL